MGQDGCAAREAVLARRRRASDERRSPRELAWRRLLAADDVRLRPGRKVLGAGGGRDQGEEGGRDQRSLDERETAKHRRDATRRPSGLAKGQEALHLSGWSVAAGPGARASRRGRQRGRRRGGRRCGLARGAPRCSRAPRPVRRPSSRTRRAAAGSGLRRRRPAAPPPRPRAWAGTDGWGRRAPSGTRSPRTPTGRGRSRLFRRRWGPGRHAGRFAAVADPANSQPELGDPAPDAPSDEQRLRAYADALAEGVSAALGPWVEASVARIAEAWQ